MAKTKTTYEIIPAWLGSVTSVFTDRERTVVLDSTATQEQLALLFSIGHPAIQVKQ